MIDEFKQEVANAIKNRPDLREEYMDILQLCLDEIEQDGSTAHEIELAREDIKQLTEV